MAVCCLLARASTDVAHSELAQGHIRCQSVRLTLILLPFYGELKKIKGWNMLKDEGYFHPWAHWNLAVAKGTAGTCEGVAHG